MEQPFQTIIEPFKIKMVERIRLTTRRERAQILKEAGYNLFNVKALDVLIDLLTDSGTSAMSDDQWGMLMRGDEAYAGSRSYYRFESRVKELFGFKHVIPVHQGRAAERILFDLSVKEGAHVPNNTHFDTTRANIEYSGGRAVDLQIAEGQDFKSSYPFKGNIDIAALTRLIEEVTPARIPLIMITVTNNSLGGQPVSMANIKEVRAIADKYGLPFYIDACRFAENCYFIHEREEGYRDTPIIDIAKELFSYADGCTFSAKKDGLANMGGFLATNEDGFAEEARNLLILTEGFTTYGGLSGRDLDVIAQGLVEVLDYDYLTYRTASVRYLGRHLEGVGVPIFNPPGGHAVYIDAREYLPHIPPLSLPGQALVAELYLEGGIRAVEIGTVMFGTRDPLTGEEKPGIHDLVRLAVPRRVYAQSHIDYVVETMGRISLRKERIRGMRIVKQPRFLRHFTAQFNYLD